MSIDVFALTCDKLGSASFVGFRGVEQISRPYEFELFFTVPTGTAVRKAVGERASLKGDRTDTHEPFVLHGVIASVKLLHQTSERALYQALLVPQLWLLKQCWRSYVFTQRTVKEFLSETLTAGGLTSSDFRFEIEDSLYATEEFVAQYRESHLEFFHRWLEREGLYYYFEHKADAATEVLVVVDSLGRHSEFSSNGHVSYVPLFGDDATAIEGLHQLEAETRWLPKTVTIADYNYANPSASLKGESAITQTGRGTITDYGFRAFDEKSIKRLSDVRAQAIGCRETMLRASGDVLGPRAGYRLAIDDQPEDIEEKWLALVVEHTGAISGMTPEVARMTKLSSKETYQMSIVAIPSDVQYRAPQDTAWPRIYGFENGIVCGDTTSPYAQLDKDGRYLVRFEFDTSDLPDGKASTRVRMLQPHGGEKEGFHFPLRKGTEVMIGFLGGDPDRPFIAGVVPNAHKQSVVGERNNTQNIIRTGSNNQIVLEDEQGKEFIFMSTPNNKTGLYMGHPTGAQSKVFTGEGGSTEHMFINPAAAGSGNMSDGSDPTVSMWQVTCGDMGVYVEGNNWVNVFGSENVFVKSSVAHGYRGTFTLDIGGDSTEKYHSKRTTTVTSGQEDTINGTGLKQTITSKLDQTVNGTADLHVTGNTIHLLDSNWTSTVKGNWNAKFADGSVTIDATPGTLNVVAKQTIDFSALSKIVLKGPEVTIDSPKFTHLQAESNTYGVFSGSAYAFKTDEVGIAQSFTGVAIETKLVAITAGATHSASFGNVAISGLATVISFACGLDNTLTDLWAGVFKKT